MYVSDKGEVKLFLMRVRVAGDIHSAKIIFDLGENVTLGAAQRAGHFRVDAQGGLLESLPIQSASEPPRFLKDLITHSLR